VSRDPEFFYVQAERLVSEGKFAAAELMLRQATELGGNNRVYVAALAALLSLQEGRAEESMTLVEEQLALHPNEPNLLVAQALAAKATGQTELAENSLRRAVLANPNHAFAHHSLGRVLVDSGRSSEAEPHACKAFALVPDQPDYALAAIDLLEAAGKSDYAFEVASLGASFCPHEMELVQKAVEGALAREEPARAWDALQESNDDLPWVLGWKATLLDYNGELEKADEMLEIGREKFAEEPDFLFLEAAIYVRRQLNQEAMEVIESLLEICPSHRGALRLRADLAFGSQSDEEALADLQAMLDLDPTDEAVAVELTSAFYRSRRYREALDICLHWETLPPPLPPQLAVYRVLCHAGLGEPQEALEKMPAVSDHLITAALSEMAAYGCYNPAEQAVRERLLERVPAEALEASLEEPEDEPEAEAETESDLESPPDDAPVPGSSVGTRLELPHPALLGESPAYEDDDEDEEIWVEIDEETGEEYVWVEEDEEE
jgi:tetratricopeptide (TPR) repeat protein